METNANNEQAIVINFSELFHYILTKMWIVIIAGALMAGLGGVYATTRTVQPSYQSVSKLYVTGVATSAPSSSGFSLGQQTINNYIQIMNSRPVLAEVINNLGLSINTKQLLSCITQSNPSGTCMLEVYVDFPDPDWAQAITTELVNVSASYAMEIMGCTPPVVYEDASLPTAPTNETDVSAFKYAVLGGIGGVFISGILILLGFFVSPLVDSPEKIQNLIGFNTLGIFLADPKSKNKEKSLKASQNKNNAYRILYSNLCHTGISNKVISILAPTKNENRKEAGLEFAKYLTDLGKKVVYVDTNFGNLTLSYINDAKDKKIGLSDYLNGDSQYNEIVKKDDSSDTYRVYPGKEILNATEFLYGDLFKSLLTKLKEEFDFVILDTAPVNSGVDAEIVSQLSDCSLLVISADTTTKRDTKNAVIKLTSVKEKIVGVVLNNISVKKKGKQFIRNYGSFFGKYQ